MTGHTYGVDLDDADAVNQRWPSADDAIAVGSDASDIEDEARTDGGSASAADEDIDAILDELEKFDSMDLNEADPDTLDQYFDAQDRLTEAVDAELDEDALSEATHIWWNDQAEFHLYCGEHYYPIANEQWTGFTEVNDPQAVKQAARDRLESGVPCEKCHSQALYERRDELLEERDLK